MNESTASTTEPKAPVLYIWKKTPAERHAHVAMRMAQRGGITWTVEQVAALEKKINFVRQQMHLNKPVAPILPARIGIEPNTKRHTHYWRCLIAGKSHTFAYSTLAKGLVSYRGPGELGHSAFPEDAERWGKKEDAK